MASREVAPLAGCTYPERELSQISRLLSGAIRQGDSLVLLTLQGPPGDPNQVGKSLLARAYSRWIRTAVFTEHRMEPPHPSVTNCHALPPVITPEALPCSG